MVGASWEEKLRLELLVERRASRRVRIGSLLNARPTLFATFYIYNVVYKSDLNPRKSLRSAVIKRIRYIVLKYAIGKLMHNLRLYCYALPN